MKQIVLAFAVLGAALSAQAQAAETIVKCSVAVEGTTQWVKLRLGSDGNIVDWSKKSLVAASKNSIFSPLDEANEESFEWVNRIRGRNGFNLIEAGTSADSFMIGVSRDRTKGFFKYRDLGSGNGHHQNELTCKIVKK